MPLNAIGISPPDVAGVAPTFQATHAIINAKRSTVLKSSGEQKQILKEYVAGKRKQESEECCLKQKDAVQEFVLMLQKTKELTSSMRCSVMSQDASLILPDDLGKPCRDGQIYSVLSAVNIMDERGLYALTHILSCLLQMCMNRADHTASRKLHHLLIRLGYHMDCNLLFRLGYDMDCHLASKLVYFYLVCASLLEVLQEFDRVSTTNVFLGSEVISRLGSNWQALKSYHQMQESGARPDKHILVVALKVCSKLASLDLGRLIHGYIIQRGLGSDVFIVSALIDMYSRSSSIKDAQRVFDVAPIKTVVVWNTLIKGHVENGLVLRAIKLYHQMQQQGIEVDKITYICILRTCISVSDVEQGRAIHQQVVQKGLELDSFVVTRLIDMYGSSGCLLDALTVFEAACKQDLRIWNAMISTYSQHGHTAEALSLLKDLQQVGLEANITTAMSLLKGISQVPSLDQGRLMHSTVVDLGFDRELPIMNTFITMYARCESLKDACRVFNSVQSPDIVTWNAIIGAHAMHEQGMNALQLFDHLQRGGWDTNWLTLCASLNACSSVGAISEGLLIHSIIIKKGLELDVMVMNNLVDMYIKCGNLTDAFEVFNSVPNRDVVTWTTLVSGLIQRCQYEKGLQLFQEMHEEGVLPNHVTIASVLKACHCLNALDQGQHLHQYIVALGLDSEIAIINSLIDMYAKCGTLQDGRQVFHKAPIRDVVTWTSMIEACVQHESGPEALYLFTKMQHEGMKPDRAAFLSTLKACSCTAALSQGKRIHRQSFDGGLGSDNTIVNSLIDMYMKCGSLLDAQQLFEEATSRDIVTWTSMISGCARLNNYDLALEYFQNMQQVGITPNCVTFLALLSACTHLGLVKEALSHFRSMLNLGLPQRLEHLTCIAEVLARNGHLDAAEDVFETSPFPLDIAGWQCLLPCCRSNVGMARRCFDYLASMNCRNAAAFILMANIYVAAGFVESAVNIEKLRCYANAWKKAGKAYIEVGERVHEFIGGDILAPEISVKLNELVVEMKQRGYTPDVDLVLLSTSDKEKESVLCGHCEKQAIVFGLLNTPPGASIRVSKNLRMCTDCHNASSAISKIERREIIITDELCVHVFKDGKCSCKVDDG